MMSRLSSVVPLIALLLASCSAAVPPWGPSLDSAKQNADNTFAAFAFRFYNVQRDAKFTVARPLMARYALIPSRILDDTAVWSAMTADSVRALYLQGSMTDAGYTFTARSAAPYPERLGDERHVLQLTRLRDGEFEWITRVDHGIGPVRAPQVGAVFGALFTAFEGRTDAALREDTQRNFSRTARHMGRLFSLTSLRTTAAPGGTTALALQARVTPDSLRHSYPAFAAYLDKYVMPSHGRMRLADSNGTTFADFRIEEGVLSVRLRARGGTLVSLDGPPASLPDSLRIHLDFSARLMLFRVGYSNLVGDFTIERGEHERGWMLRFQREPDWHFPLGTDRLIRSPLRRPFEGRGTELRLAVRDDLGRQAMSLRQVRTAVRESAIMRWLGGLGSTAFGDFAGRSEAEENRFLSELFSAMRQDVAALTP